MNIRNQLKVAVTSNNENYLCNILRPLSKEECSSILNDSSDGELLLNITINAMNRGEAYAHGKPHYQNDIVLKIILDNGANPALKDDTGLSAYDLAFDFPHFRRFQLYQPINILCMLLQASYRLQLSDPSLTKISPLYYFVNAIKMNCVHESDLISLMKEVCFTFDAADINNEASESGKSSPLYAIASDLFNCKKVYGCAALLTAALKSGIYIDTQSYALIQALKSNDKILLDAYNQHCAVTIKPSQPSFTGDSFTTTPVNTKGVVSMMRQGGLFPIQQCITQGINRIPEQKESVIAEAASPASNPSACKK